MRIRLRISRAKQFPQPVIELAVDDQVNSIRQASVFNPMWQTEVEVPALAWLHHDPVSIKKKVHAVVGSYRNVQPNLSAFKTKVVVALLTDDRPRRQFKEPNHANRTVKGFEKNGY